eukprot:scaffold868_cov351-Pavlova_lutheri.AAC.13
MAAHQTHVNEVQRAVNDRDGACDVLEAYEAHPATPGRWLTRGGGRRKEAGAADGPAGRYDATNHGECADRIDNGRTSVDRKEPTGDVRVAVRGGADAASEKHTVGVRDAGERVGTFSKGLPRGRGRLARETHAQNGEKPKRCGGGQ